MVSLPPQSRFPEHSGSPWSRVGDDLTHADGGEFADLLALACSLLEAPVAALSVGEDGQYRLLAQQGLGSIVTGSGLLSDVDAGGRMISDAAADPVLRDDPLVAGPPGLRFVLALPVESADGRRLGTLAVADTRPRDGLPQARELLLGQLGRLAARLLERHQLQRRNRIATQIMQADFSALVVVDADGGVVFVNRAAELLFGGRARGMRAMPVDLLFPSALQIDPERAAAWLQGRSDPATIHLRVPGPDGPRTLEAARCAWRLRDGDGLALVLRDITEQINRHAELRHAAMVDPLTGLPNRNAFMTLLAGHLEAPGPVAFALLGLDRFKVINDTVGHDAGDAVLRSVAARLQAVLPRGALLGRFGGDEFAIAWPGIELAPLGMELSRLLQVASQPEQIDGHPIHIDASIGAAIRADHGDAACTPGELVARADLALYKAKAAGGRQCCHFDPGMRQEVDARRKLEAELRAACRNGEFELHYQPQIDLDSGRTFGAEALLRWRHPVRGLIGPVDFIDALAGSPVAAEVGRWIIGQACRDAAAWPSVDGRELAISINLFPVQVNNGRLRHEVDEALAASGLAPERLELEITETIALTPGDAASDALASLRDRGVRLSFDDFGTGFASLSMLQRMRVDRVKIDRSFVRDMLANNGDAAIVKSILLISSNFALNVIAEGVENPEQAQLLRGLGCHGAQGFLYAPALSPQAFGEWLAAQPGRPATPARVGVDTLGHV